jgi:hypothetical protein
MTEKLELALRLIKNCHICNGTGYHYYGNGEDYFDAESCECNIYEIILDQDGDVIWDNGLLSEPELAIFGTSEAN